MYKSRISSRMLGKWIQEYIENHADEDCSNGKKVKVIRELARLPDGTVVKKTTDGCLTISTVFKPSALSDGFQKYGNKEPNWSGALLILKKFRIQFQCTPKEPFGEYTLVVDKFSVWNLQEGFGLKYDLINCMWVPEIRALAAKERQKMLEESQNRRDELDHLLDAMNSTHSQAEHSQVNEDSSVPDSLMEKLRQPFTSKQFVIPDSQLKILESLAEWQSDYIPSSSSQSASTANEQLVQMVHVHTSGKTTSSSDNEAGNAGLEEQSKKIDKPENSGRKNSEKQSVMPETNARVNQHIKPVTKCDSSSAIPNANPGTSFQENSVNQGVKAGTSIQYKDEKVVLPGSSGQYDNSSCTSSQTQADEYAWQGNVDSVRFSDESLDGCLYIDENPSSPKGNDTCKIAEEEKQSQSKESNIGNSKDTVLKDKVLNLVERNTSSQSPILISSEESEHDKFAPSSGSRNSISINSSSESLDFGIPLAASTQADSNRLSNRLCRMRRSAIDHSHETNNKTSTPKAYLEKSNKQEEEDSCSIDISEDGTQKKKLSALDMSIDTTDSEHISPLPRNNKIMILKHKLDSCIKKIGMDKSKTQVVRTRKGDQEENASLQPERDRDTIMGASTGTTHDMKSMKQTFQGTFQQYVQHCENSTEVSGSTIESSGDSVVSPSPEADISNVHPVTRSFMRRMTDKKICKSAVTNTASCKNMGKSGFEKYEKASVEKMDAVSSQSLNDYSLECVINSSMEVSLDQTERVCNEVDRAGITKTEQTETTYSMNEPSLETDKSKENDMDGSTDLLQCNRFSEEGTPKSPPHGVKTHRYIGVLVQKDLNQKPITHSGNSDLEKKSQTNNLQANNEECSVTKNKTAAHDDVHYGEFENQTQMLNVKQGQIESFHSSKGSRDDENGSRSGNHVETDVMVQLPVGNEEEHLYSGTQPFEVGLEGTIAFSPDLNNTAGYSLEGSGKLKSSSPQDAGQKMLGTNDLKESEKQIKGNSCEILENEKEIEENSSCESQSILTVITSKSNKKPNEISEALTLLTENEENGAPFFSTKPISTRKRRRYQISDESSNKKVKMDLDIDNEITQERNKELKKVDRPDGKKYDNAVNDTHGLTRIKDKIHTSSDDNTMIDLATEHAIPKHTKENQEFNPIEVNSSPDIHELTDVEYTDSQSSKNISQESGSEGRVRSEMSCKSVKVYEPKKIFIDGRCAGNKVHWMNFTEAPYKKRVSEPKQNSSKQRSSLQRICATSTRNETRDKPIGHGTLMYNRSGQSGRFVRIDKSNKSSEDENQIVTSPVSRGDDQMQKGYETENVSLLESDDSPISLEDKIGTISSPLERHSKTAYQPQSDDDGKSKLKNIPLDTDNSGSSDKLSPANMYLKKLLSAVVIRTDTEKGKRLHRMKLDLQRDLEKDRKLV